MSEEHCICLHGTWNISQIDLIVSSKDFPDNTQDGLISEHRHAAELKENILTGNGIKRLSGTNLIHAEFVCTSRGHIL